MSDMTIVVVGVVSVLCGVAVVTWLGRPSEFRAARHGPVPSPPLYVSGPPQPPVPQHVVAPPLPSEARHLLGPPWGATPAERRWEPAFALPRTITRGAGEQAAVWAQPPPSDDGAREISSRKLDAPEPAALPRLPAPASRPELSTPS
jgi:hypothetical protein